MKKIKLFEAFAGIGSQYKALKNISKDKKWDIEVVAIVEWYVDASRRPSGLRKTIN